MVIKVDVDGVIREFLPYMCKCYNRIFGEHLQEKDITDYDINQFFPRFVEKGTDAMSYFFRDEKEATETLYVSADEFPEVRKVLTELRASGHRIVIVTWQLNAVNMKLTIDFLNYYKIPYDDICFTKEKWLIKGDVLIDDNPEFINDPRETAAKFLVTRRYNENMYVNEDVTRIADLEGFLKHISQ